MKLSWRMKLRQFVRKRVFYICLFFITWCFVSYWVAPDGAWERNITVFNTALSYAVIGALKVIARWPDDETYRNLHDSARQADRLA
jgi:hypothetical protein